MAEAQVDSITSCAGGHHGVIFYDRQARLERRHAHLQRNLV